jgi:hypothetical protein
MDVEGDKLFEPPVTMVSVDLMFFSPNVGKLGIKVDVKSGTEMI